MNATVTRGREETSSLCAMLLLQVIAHRAPQEEIDGRGGYSQW